MLVRQSCKGSLDCLLLMQTRVNLSNLPLFSYPHRNNWLEKNIPEAADGQMVLTCAALQIKKWVFVASPSIGIHRISIRYGELSIFIRFPMQGMWGKESWFAFIFSLYQCFRQLGYFFKRVNIKHELSFKCKSEILTFHRKTRVGWSQKNNNGT